MTKSYVIQIHYIDEVVTTPAFLRFLGLGYEFTYASETPPDEAQIAEWACTQVSGHWTYTVVTVAVGTEVR